jgi:hypothetical protein
MDQRFRIWTSKHFHADTNILSFAMKAVDSENPHDDVAVIATFYVYGENGSRLFKPGWVGDHKPTGEEYEVAAQQRCEFLDGRPCCDHMRTMGQDWIDTLVEEGEDGVWNKLYGDLQDLVSTEEPVAT